MVSVAFSGVRAVSASSEVVQRGFSSLFFKVQTRFFGFQGFVELLPGGVGAGDYLGGQQVVELVGGSGVGGYLLDYLGDGVGGDLGEG